MQKGAVLVLSNRVAGIGRLANLGDDPFARQAAVNRNDQSPDTLLKLNQRDTFPDERVWTRPDQNVQNRPKSRTVIWIW
jgi:hypothetical protein